MTYRFALYLAFATVRREVWTAREQGLRGTQWEGYG